MTDNIENFANRVRAEAQALYAQGSYVIWAVGCDDPDAMKYIYTSGGSLDGRADLFRPGSAEPKVVQIMNDVMASVPTNAPDEYYCGKYELEAWVVHGKPMRYTFVAEDIGSSRALGLLGILDPVLPRQSRLYRIQIADHNNLLPGEMRLDVADEHASAVSPDRLEIVIENLAEHSGVPLRKEDAEYIVEGVTDAILKLGGWHKAIANGIVDGLREAYDKMVDTLRAGIDKDLAAQDRRGRFVHSHKRSRRRNHPIRRNTVNPMRRPTNDVV